MKVDPYKTKQSFESWRAKGSVIEGVSKSNEKLIVEFITDLETGTNVCRESKKGARSFIRLNSYKSKLKVIIIPAEKRFKRKNIKKLKKKEFNIICNDLRGGKIKRNDGKSYIDAADYIKSFKAFWHWLQKKELGLEDITIEADVSKDKPKWVYLELNPLKKMIDSCKPFYKTLAYFGLDTGARPGEILNIRVSDFEKDFSLLDIRDEISKTFGRKIKLMLCNDLIKGYIRDNNLKGDDLLFPVTLREINQYFKRKASSMFGDKKSKAGAKYSEFTLGDVRHNASCYWLPRYPTQQGMMYRFGWKKPDKIFYYSEFLGMQDNIQEDNLLIDVTKTDIQKELEELKKNSSMENAELRDEIKRYSEGYRKILEKVNRMAAKVENKK